jgi:toxin ParE1/3/4
MRVPMRTWRRVGWSATRPSHAGSARSVGKRRCRARVLALDVRFVWTDEAVGQLESVVTYVAAFDADAARRLGARLIAVADSLADFPHRGGDAGAGRREMTRVWPYVLRYRVEGERVVILRVRHDAREEDEAGA